MRHLPIRNRAFEFILVVLFSIWVGFGWPTHAALPPIEQIQESNSLSQLVRANAWHFWVYAKSKSGSLSSGLFQYQGLVVGDPHPGNFMVLPATQLGKARDLHYLLADIDDIGIGPFAIDFIRYVATVKAISDRFLVTNLQGAYVEGLKNPSGRFSKPLPTLVANAFKTTIGEYDQLVKARVLHFTRGKSTLSRKEVEDLLGWSIQDFIPLGLSGPLLDFGHRLQDRGGNLNSIRIWLLYGSTQSMHIDELKEWRRTSLENWAPQPTLSDLYQIALKSFFDNFSSIDQKYISLKGYQFLEREKRFQLIDIPYGIGDAKKFREVEELSEYGAFLLGQLHGKQKASTGYTFDLQNPIVYQAFLRSVEDLVDDYLQILRKASGLP